MDIRNYFGKPSKSLKKQPEKAVNSPTKTKTTDTNKNEVIKIKEKKPKKDTQPEDDVVEIIDESDEDIRKTSSSQTAVDKSKKGSQSSDKNKSKKESKDNRKSSDSSRSKDSITTKTESSSRKRNHSDAKQNGDKKESKKEEKKKERSKEHDKEDSKPNDKSEKDKKRDDSKMKEKRKKPAKISSDDELDEDDEEVQVVRKPKKKQKVKSGNIIFDSDDENATSPSPKKKKRERRKKEVVYNSDDEHSIKHMFQKMTPKSEKPKPKPESEKKASPKIQVSAIDFFGTGTVQMKDKTPAKRKAESSPVKPTDPDEEMHDDDDFEQTLKQLDEREQKHKKQRTESPTKSNNTGSSSKVSSNETKGPSLAGKLAAKAKLEILAAETPEKTSPTKKRNTDGTVKRSPMKVSPPKVSPPTKVSPGKPSSACTSPQDKKPSPAKSPEEKTPGMARNNTGYRAYLHREGPRSLGSKEIPQGADNCLEGLTFVITGVLESVERDEAKSQIERYGGKVTGSLSKKTNYLVLGRDAGVSKTAKAEQFGTTILDEDGLFDLIRTKPGKKSKYQVQAEKEAKSSPAPSKKLQDFKATPKSSPQMSKKPEAASPALSSQSSQSSQKTMSPQKSVTGSGETLLWVDKYKPTTLKQIIGQQGDRSNAKKLLNWLKSWHRNIASGRKPAFKSEDGAGFKAALLSGPPGVGKTTTATLVCQEAGFSYVELNASDTRSKKSLQNEVSESLNNHTLVDFIGAKSESKSNSSDGRNHCMVMDEVDGMAGNEDRGGMAELVGLIKNSKIPIICMCNDRNHPKMRTLSNHCFDLRFQRPRVEQIKAAMMSMSFKEGLKIPPPALNEIILASNQDVRQVIHNLSMWSVKDKALTYDQLKADANKARKDMKIGPFDVVRKVFSSGEETAGMTIHDKSDLFFQDYSFGPLFVQENYPYVTPHAAKGDIKNHLDLLSQAADSIAAGDLVDRKIRSGMNWSLLPLQAIFSSVAPGDIMRGHMSGMIQFPGWLGKNSSKNKVDRILQELRGHMRLKISGNKVDLGSSYLPHMRKALTEPLIQHGQDGIAEVIGLMDEYALLREDIDNIMEVSGWPDKPDPMSKIETKVKSAFTRTYNKEVHLTPYSTVAPAKKKRGKGGGGGYEDELEGLEGGEGEGKVGEDSGEESDLETDGMIKAKKKPAAKGKGGGGGGGGGKKGGGASGKGQATAGKGKGKGKGKK